MQDLFAKLLDDNDGVDGIVDDKPVNGRVVLDAILIKGPINRHRT